MRKGTRVEAGGVRLLAAAAVDLIAAETAGDAAHAAYRHLAGPMDLDVFLLQVIEQNRPTLLLDSYAGIDPRMAMSISRMPCTDGICGSVEPLRAHFADGDQIAADPRLGIARALGLSACACFPLVGRDGFIGMLTFATRRRRHVTRSAFELMRVLATHVAVAVERARTHERLREGEQRVRAIFDNAGVGLVEVDTDDRFVAVNDRVCAILGYRRDELLGSTVHDLTAPEDRQESDRLNRELHEGVRDRIDYEKRYLRRDGSPLWVHVTVSPVRDAAGRWARSIATIEDIGERKAAEIALSKTERLLRHHMDNSPLPAIQLDGDGRITRWSAMSERVFGWSADEVLGTSLHDRPFVHPDDRAALDATLGDLLSGRTVRNTGMCRHVRRDGTMLHCEWFSSAWTDDEGRLSILSRLLDVSARTRAEEDRRNMEAAQARSEQRFRELADSMPQIVWTADATGEVDYYNQRWSEFTGLSATDGHGAGWAPVVHPDDQRKTMEAWSRAISTGVQYQVEHRVRRGDGTFRWLLSRGTPVPDGSGRVRWYGTATDIHEQKLAEEKLREADRRKDEFLATLAHELRNPLAPIRFALKLLEQGDLHHPGAERSRQVIERQVEHLVRLVDDLLDVSRITRNKIQLRKERVHLRTLMNSAVESTVPQLRAAGHRLVFRCDANVPLDADAARLVQVFTNLLNNAVKFTPPSGEISFTTDIADGHVVIRVKDSGIGIAPDALPHVFDMFHQAENSLERSVGGLGIGLTLARRLVEMHGGSVQARSNGPNHGAEFAVLLPIAAADAVDARRVLERAAPAVAPPSAMRVLIVDDNVDSAEMLALVAAMQGHDTRTAHDGPGALTAFEEFLPDVVLLDIGLPGLNGYEVARRLREQRRHLCHLVAITGWGQEQDRRRAREAGFDCHMTKPADPDVLTRLLAAISSGGRCDACDRCLPTPLTRSGDLRAGSTLRGGTVR